MYRFAKPIVERMETSLVLPQARDVSVVRRMVVSPSMQRRVRGKQGRVFDEQASTFRLQLVHAGSVPPFAS